MSFKHKLHDNLVISGDLLQHEFLITQQNGNNT